MGQVYKVKLFAGEADSQQSNNGVETMAGDWLAVRLDLFDDPAVVCISAKTAIEPDLVVGKLIRIWSWANRHLQDGMAKGISVQWVDQYVSATGFAAAMIESGWLQERSGSIHFPKFDVWNSESAKRRLLETRRKQKKRIEESCPQNVRKMSASHADKNGTRGKERRGEERREVGGRADRPTVSASPVHQDGTVQGFAETAAHAYQARRYKTPNPRAAYYPVLLQEAEDVLEAATDKQAALNLFLKTCIDSPLPKDASFSDLAKSCGLKKSKLKAADRPSQQFKDFTAERLAKQMSIDGQFPATDLTV